MLTKKELWLNLKANAFCSRYAILPIKIRDEVQGDLEIVSGQRHRMWLLATIVHSLYIWIQFVLALVANERVISRLIISGLCAMGSLSMIFVNWVLFVDKAELHEIIYRILIKSWTAEDGRNKAGISIRDLVILGLPVNIFPIPLAMPGLYVLMPNVPSLVYYGMRHFGGTYLTNFILIIGSCVIDTLCAFFWVANGYYVVFVILMFFEGLNQRLVSAISSLRWSQHSMAASKYFHGVKTLRSLRLEVELFNRLFSTMVYAFKLFDLTWASLGLFCMFRFIHTRNAIVAVITFIVALNGITGFVFMFDKAFKIPEMMEEMRTKLSAILEGKAVKGSFRRSVRTDLAAVAKVGIKLGNFQTFERTSTLNFLGFVFAQVVNLELTVPQF